ncbi:ectoine/hydroxyectoine ABC transporter permease subunit EhuD [Salinisphaera hydrothermalis]|uniref:Ectoine/hydroxyectoine ABC transporter permease EhuD n=1 Tax=Salinisphaera hydrothermalis (strain C41B8) TaxID=1304275 RepID=A0A084IK45_SALHC|nr:ectoine/hydroxyectoine ABC transporter permease subunit EhuD [Salinisphaera hydrothermalis]KEZ77079.1 ectoine/hydroxyectoine ABC transporter permease EhuD [Salinisphaera hydrothermalis C41B8]
MLFGMSWDLTNDWTFAWSIIPMLLIGMKITIIATIFGFLIAMTLGLVFALARSAPTRFISWPVGFVIEFVRDTPLLIQLFFIFYVLPSSTGITLPALEAGILALGVQYSAYCSEVYRAGLQAVPNGQWEAARALNLSTWQTYRDIVIPQAIPRIIPALGNYLVSIIKDTPILSAITVMEVLHVANIIGDRTYRYMVPITMVGILFLILTLISAGFVKFIEKRLPRAGIAVK